MQFTPVSMTPGSTVFGIPELVRMWPWRPVLDVTTDEYYFHNQADGSVSWSLADTESPPQPPQPPPLDGVPTSEPVQVIYPWKPVLDIATRSHYYHNTETDEVSWDPHFRGEQARLQQQREQEHPGIASQPHSQQETQQFGPSSRQQQTQPQDPRPAHQSELRKRGVSGADLLMNIGQKNTHGKKVPDAMKVRVGGRNPAMRQGQTHEHGGNGYKGVPGHSNAVLSGLLRPHLDAPRFVPQFESTARGRAYSGSAESVYDRLTNTKVRIQGGG
jgi:hypothetical protein